MKLLSISAVGLPLFKEELSLSFIAEQRVSAQGRDQLHLLRNDSSFYLNNVEALIGINASGKTSVLKVVLLALSLLNNTIPFVFIEKLTTSHPMLPALCAA